MHAQTKVASLSTAAKGPGLKINVENTNKAMRINAINREPLSLEEENMEDVNNFAYLGATVSTTGGAEQDIREQDLARPEKRSTSRAESGGTLN